MHTVRIRTKVRPCGTDKPIFRFRSRSRLKFMFQATVSVRPMVRTRVYYWFRV